MRKLSTEVRRVRVRDLAREDLVPMRMIPAVFGHGLSRFYDARYPPGSS